MLRSADNLKRFSTRVREFFGNHGCKVRFFMTWISSLKSFVESLFRSHPDACLVIVSNSMDSESGSLVLKPFLDKRFKLIAIKPDFDYLFKDTHAEKWFKGLKKGNVSPVTKLRNVIGAQTLDLETRNWSRLNNAVLIFDKKHPLLFKFIEEFALTFDGNKWGHNGPYLVSRVVSRVNGRPEFNFTVLPPSAFYPVNWSRIRNFFRGPRDKVHSSWLHKKLEQIKSESFAVHLWNKQSREIKVESGSIINYIMLDCCVFCNSSSSSL
ncbi:hypothetical protein NC653_027257 [Populus alba x Populus x berolinensis]|uniref:Alpha 1,4-glycosyltransferase domain-containing protein n=1 Tax=Populus alba x Populus x berolinensis TaxID=444605 RepID=A0AAD6M7H8_9ROSI|nr:hypothetical protein NC653_027257 [Populus alba x Populus x berolinensis]